jgi:adhesin HecA-like repeat protein
MSGLSPTASLLPILSLKEAQQQLTTQFAAVATVAPNTDQGSAIQALLNTTALLFSQGQVAQVALVNVSRLATSFGPDADSFVAAFGYTREGASASSGLVTFSLNSGSSDQIVIPIGTIVIASSGLQFTVVVDESQMGYSAALGGYVISVGNLSVNATVVCNTAGTIGNVKAAQISAIFGGSDSPVPTVDTVSNPQDFTNGQDQESDAALKTRFTLGMSGGRGGTDNALAAAILGVQEGLTYSIGDMKNITGTGAAPQTTTSQVAVIPAVNSTLTVPVANPNAIPYLGYVVLYDTAHAMYGQVTGINAAGGTITVTCLAILVAGTLADPATVLFVGGSGFFTIVANILGQASGPSAALLSAIASKIDVTRAAGICRSIIGPTLVPVNTAGTLVIADGYTGSDVLTAAQTANDAFLNNLGLDPAGNPTICGYIDVAIAIRQVPGVKRLDNFAINGSTADITAPFASQLVAGTFTFTTA